MNRTDLEGALTQLVARLGEPGVPACSALLYGSAARGDWIAGRSDINLLLVMEDATAPALTKLATAVTEWHRGGHTAPLIIGRAEWQRSVDVFPIEMTDMQLCHRVLLGDDPLDGVVVDPTDLRRALESELRGKLVRLRQAYVRFGASAPTLGGFATASIGELLVLLRCTAVLLGRDPGKSAASVVAVLADLLGGDGEVAVEIASHRPAAEWSCPPETFVRYLSYVYRAVEFIDHHSQGER